MKIRRRMWKVDRSWWGKLYKMNGWRPHVTYTATDFKHIGMGETAAKAVLDFRRERGRRAGTYEQ